MAVYKQSGFSCKIQHLPTLRCESGMSAISNYCISVVPLKNIIQLFHTFMCDSQNYRTRGAVDGPMALLHEAEGNSTSVHVQN